MFQQKSAVWFLLIGMLILSLALASPASAQEPTPENDANCVSCHDDQYYLYDSGKYFCLCEAPMHCVYCHGGRVDSYEKEIAHEGLVLYPTRDQAQRCQTCHEEDYMSRIVKFDAIAGISPTSQVVITATPVEPAAITTAPAPAAPLFTVRRLEPWRLAGLGVLAVAFIAIAIFGYRCYQLDCLSKRSNS